MDYLLTIIDQAYNRRSWHGTNLRGSLRGITAEKAARRPADGRHNIWELTVHAAYWKYVVRRRLTGEPRGSFPMKGSNWFRRPEAPGEKAWKADLEFLDEIHRSLRSVIASLPKKEIDRHFDLIAGIAAHDLYHAGQIQLLKRLSE